MPPELRRPMRGEAAQSVMNHFRDLSGLHDVMQYVYRSAPGEDGRALFANALVNELGFGERQAALYASVVLSQNDDGSADRVRRNVLDIMGAWTQMESSGMAAALLSTRTETWTFEPDLTYLYKLETYEGYSSPFGASYSIPRTSGEAGIWAPGDRPGGEVELVVMDVDGRARKLALSWLDAGEPEHRRCTIDGREFSRR